MALLIMAIYTAFLLKALYKFKVKRAREARDQILFCDLQNVQKQREIYQSSLN